MFQLKKPSTTRFYVTVEGHMAPLVGSSSVAAILTFSRPVQVPRATLPAGTYLFTMISPSVMRVTNESGTRTYATFNTVPTGRSRDIDRPQLRFERATAGGPFRLIGVYLEGSSTGYQPLYPTMRKGSEPVATTGTESDR